MRALRILAPIRVSDARQTTGNQRTRRAAFVVATVALIVELVISGNTLNVMGVDYGSPGGNPIVKLHPATYLVTLAAFMVVLLARPAGSGAIRLFRETPALASYLLLILFCAFYSITNVGFSGAAVYIESYISAGLLAIVLEAGSDRQKRTIGWWIIGFCLISIAISIGEGATQTHLIPMQIGNATPKEIAQESEDFRGSGLFGHPLTAALVTSMAIFMLLRMRMNNLLKAGLFTTLLIGLLSFGGRAALGMTLIILTGAAGVVILRGRVTRNLSLGFVGALAAALVILPPLILMIVTTTDIGERIITHLYLDDSADVRSTQWLVLNHLNLHDVLFGVPPERLDVLKYQIGLGSDTTDIENFWLLMFLNLGAIGFVVFLVALGLFIAHLGRTTAHPLGWMLLAVAIIVDSTSNSLGRKSPDLFYMVACMIAMTGYPRTAPAVSVSRRAITSLRRVTGHLAARPPHANMAGFKS